jgi:hypothetical protein
MASMKRLATLLVLLLFTTVVYSASLDTFVGGGYSVLTKEKAPSVSGYFVQGGGFFVSKPAIGFTGAIDISYLYSRGFERAYDEMQIMREFVMFQKNLYTTWRLEKDTGVDTLVRKMTTNVFLSLGQGAYNFIQTQNAPGEESNDETFGAFRILGGVSYKGIALAISCDVVQIKGPDMVIPSVGLKVDFADE